MRFEQLVARLGWMGTLAILSGVGLLGFGCLTMVGVAAMDVATKSENNRKKRAVVGCHEAGPVGYVVGTDLEGRGLSSDIYLRECSTDGEELTPVPVDPSTFESFGEADGFHWGRDAKRLVVQHVPIAEVGQSVPGVATPDPEPLIRSFALPERLILGEFETTFLLAGDSVLYRDRGVLRSETDHPYGWLGPVDVSSFTTVGVRYAKDASSVWYRDQRIEGADAETFQVLAPHFARDRRSIYFAATRMSEVDSASFRVSSNLTAEDRQATYRLELTERGWRFFCGDVVCHEQDRVRTLPGQRIEWTEYDRFMFR